jgi:hypothetical protein
VGELPLLPSDDELEVVIANRLGVNEFAAGIVAP